MSGRGSRGGGEWVSGEVLKSNLEETVATWTPERKYPSDVSLNKKE